MYTVYTCLLAGVGMLGPKAPDCPGPHKGKEGNYAKRGQGETAG